MLYARTRTDKIIYSFLAHPGRLIVLSFLFVILLGSFLLNLPWATKDGIEFTYFDALFTATSATCVTGLIVADTQTTFTVFGKIVLICLIQIGGLGLVTITSMFMTFTGRMIGLKTRRLALESAGSFSYSELPILLKFIFGVTFGCEALGAVFLSIAYVPIFGMKQGIIKATFQSISAFCNAGFDLMGDSAGGPYSSLSSVYDNPLALITTSCLILFGGLGFIVWVDIASYAKKRSIRPHSRIMLKATLLLLVIGTVLVLIFEWNNTLADQPFGVKLLSSMFQSVTYRTAGFNSIDLAAMTPASKTFAIVLMFIGAGAGSTGGGIKVTVFLIVLYMMISEFKGEEDVLVSKSRISMKLCHRAVAIFISGITVVLLLSVILFITEAPLIEAGKITHLDLVFESVSAFATVGVTSAGTPQLSSWGHLFIIPAMFLGRVGPITFALSAYKDNKSRINKVYPDAKINIG